MSEEINRRDVMGMALGACAVVGGGFALAGMKQAWDPLPSVKAAGTTKVDLSTAEENVLYTEKWRGKPIFILKKSSEMIASSGEDEKKRDIVVAGNRYSIFIALCTHLGCIPSYRKKDKDFLCACHGATYDVSGINTKAPAPLPMLIPPFKIDGTSLILGEAGPEYEKMKLAGVLGKTPLKTKA
jgi:ubiquinol-cytochrome c reductase iron-sulfur subunit